MPIVKVDFRQQGVPHQAIWFSRDWQRKHGFEHRHCKVCGAGEDVHVMAPEPTLIGTAASCRETAQFYRDYAGKFSVGSLGWNGNMAEAAKYDGMAARFGALAGSLEATRES
jgi:hypothetical protein